jgi:SIR2-like domain
VSGLALDASPQLDFIHWDTTRLWGELMFEEIASGLARHKLIPFFGAGVSAAHLGVVWQDIVDEMADDVGLPSVQRRDFLEVADRFVAERGDEALATLLRKRLIAAEFDDIRGWPHLFLLSLSCGVLYTTNQDNLFELAATKKGRPHRVVIVAENLAEWSPLEPLLIKYHGDLSVPESLNFSGHSFRTRIADTGNFLNIRMRSDILSKGFLFIGYSFNDPTVRLLFQELKAAFGGNIPPSFLIAYSYQKTMDELQREFGVNIVDPCSEFPDAKDHSEAFQRYLKSLSERVIQLKSEQELFNILTPAFPHLFVSLRNTKPMQFCPPLKKRRLAKR